MFKLELNDWQMSQIGTGWADDPVFGYYSNGDKVDSSELHEEYRILHSGPGGGIERCLGTGDYRDCRYVVDGLINNIKPHGLWRAVDKNNGYGYNTWTEV